MDSISSPGISRRQSAFIFVSALLLGTFAATFEYFLPVGLVKLFAYAVVASLLAFFVFVFPKRGLFLAVFYIYGGLSYYFRVPAAYPVVVMVTFATLFHLFQGGTLRVPSTTFNWSCALFVMIALTSMLFAHDVFPSLVAFSILLKSLVLVYLIVQIIKTPRDLENFALVIFYGTVATVLFGILNMRFGWIRDASVIVELGWMRFAGTHLDPNMSAVYLVSGLPLGVFAVRRCRSKMAKIAISLLSVLILLAVFLTFSRAAIFILVFVAVAVIARDVRSRKLFVPIGVVILAILMLTPAYYWHRLVSIQDFFAGMNEDWSLFLRFRALETAWNLFLAHPIIGVGLNNSMVRSNPEMFVRMLVHNAYLEILVGVGLVGFTAYMMMHVAAVRSFWKAMQKRWSDDLSWMRHLAFYMFISFLSTMVGCMFLSIPFSYVVWLPLAGGLAAGRLAAQTPSNSENH